MGYKELGINGQPIHSNEKPWCARCKQPIVEANDSGWEVFVGDGKITQPICIFCDAEDDGSGEKNER